MASTTKDKRAGYSLLGLIAVRRAKAEHQRRLAVAAARKAADTSEAPAPAKPRRRGWFG